MLIVAIAFGGNYLFVPGAVLPPPPEIVEPDPPAEPIEADRPGMSGSTSLKAQIQSLSWQIEILQEQLEKAHAELTHGQVDASREIRSWHYERRGLFGQRRVKIWD